MTASHATPHPTRADERQDRWDGTLEPTLDDARLEALLCETLSSLTPARRATRGRRLPLFQLVPTLVSALS